MTDWHVETCCKCKIAFAVPQAFYATARERCEQFTFYCPHGHPQYYVRGESELDKMRRERDRLRQQIAQKDEAIKEEQRRVSAAHGQVTRLKNRVKNGVCPCCNRTFQNLARHMQTRHPTYDPKQVHETAH